MIQTYIALNNQNIYDVCLMTYGTFDQLIKLITDNDFGSVNNYPVMGQQFLWDDTLVFNESVSVANSQNNVVYATRAGTSGNIPIN